MSLPPRVRRSVTVLGVATGLLGAFAAGAVLTGEDDEPQGRVRSVAFTGNAITLAADCDDLLDWYVARGVRMVGPWGWGAGYGDLEVYPNASEGDGMEDSGDAAGSASEPSSGGPSTVRAENTDSGTNVQEAGVDEPDVVKTDGHYLYRVEGDDLVTYDVSGAEVERLGSADLVDLAGGELLLAGDTAVVIGSTGDVQTDEYYGGYYGGYPETPATRVVVFDVSDPADPEDEHTYLFSSSTIEARLHGDTVRLVTQAGLPDLDFETDQDDPNDALQENRDIVRDSDIEDWLPTVSTDGGDPEPLLGCDDVAIPNDGNSLGTIAVIGFDLDDPEARSVSGLAVDTSLAYFSRDKLYLATTPASGFGGCMDICVPEGDLPRWLPGGDDDAGRTQLYAFDLEGDDTTYTASGRVDGWIRDRWAMDEAGGVLRVAVGPTQMTGSFNSVVTFRQDGNDLVEAGRVDELGVGEDIKSMRWFDGLAIMVTFRQVDPLYAIDLTDPDDPELIGELKIPGFSGYLHPLGAHRLLGLGEGEQPADGLGAQAGLFNVTDLTHPRQIDVEYFGNGSLALAMADPRQLTWLPGERTILTVISSAKKGGQVGQVAVLTLGDGDMDTRLVDVEYGADMADVRLVPLPDGRVVLVTSSDAEFFDL